MNKFGVLMRLNIRNRLAALRGGGLRGESGKGKAGKIATGFFIGLAYLMILAMVIFFEFAVFESLKAIGCPELLLSMALTVVMAGMVLMSFFYVLTSLYYGRDITFLASLPAASRTIFGAKLGEILLGETGIAAVALLPAMVLYGVNVPVDALYWVRMVLVVLSSAMMPVSLTALLATVVVRLTGGSKHKDAVTILYSIFIMVLVLWIEFSFMGSTNDDGDLNVMIQMLVNQQGLMRQMAQAFPPSWWAMQGLQGDWLHLLGFVACSVGCYGLFWALLGRRYLPLCLSLTENGTSRRRGKAKVKGVRQRSPLMALYLRECKEVLRTPTYAYNSLAGIIMMPVMLFAGLYSAQSADHTGMGVMLEMLRSLLMLAQKEYIFLGMLALLTFVCCINPAIDTAVSREGARHAFGRTLPVSFRTQLKAKLLMGLSINEASALVGVVAFIVLLPALWWVAVLAFLFMQVTNLGLSSFSLLLDVKRPKFHWTNEQQAIKQNGNIALGMLISLVLLAVPVAAFVLLLGKMSLTVCMVVVLAICVAEAAVGYALLMRAADTSYAALEDTGA